ncbi:Dihydrofolate reductase [Devosia sp. DBB001]|nr:Dihydrofolate reductase [Devosia sp. DBB001]
MGKLTFGMMCSLDGYISDANGKFDWGQIDEDVHTFANAEQARESTTIYGRRMFETMAAWDTLAEDPGVSQVERDFAALWRKTDKIVVSRSLAQVTTTRTRLVRELTAGDIEALKASSRGDISVSGPTLAASYLRRGFVDEVSLYYVPVVVGSGRPAFPDVASLLKLERIEVRPFNNGVTFMRFAVRK